ncbi:hypothetical protein ACFL1R_03675 [Candidatus Latescibacterota bacterium]
MKRFACGFFLVLVLMFYSVVLRAQNIYELRKLTEDEWLAMSTEERLHALGTATKHAENQTFLGDFGRYQDLYKKWGYEFYEMEDRYENYAFRDFDAYNIIEENRRRWSYNEFGDRIAKISHNATIWRETQYGNGTSTIEWPRNYINSVALDEVDGVWMARESTDDWAASVVGAGFLRTKFTPLTLSLPNINGTSIDFQSTNNSFKIVTGIYRSRESNHYKNGGVVLKGGTFHRKFGVLTLGASYANIYGVQGNREGGDT